MIPMKKISFPVIACPRSFSLSDDLHSPPTTRVNT